MQEYFATSWSYLSKASVYNAISINPILNSYRNQFAVIKIPISDNISNETIQFLYLNPVGAFSGEKLNDTSYNTLRNIMYNINRLQHIDTIDGIIFTFIVLLYDLNNNYLCSLKGFKIDNDMCFILTYIPINHYINDKSYTQTFTQMIDIYTNSCIMMEIGNMLIHKPDIFNELVLKNSQTSFSQAIQNSDYFDRLKIPNQSFFCLELATDVKEETYFFNEQKPEWNGRSTRELYLTNTTLQISSLTQQITEKYILKYNSLNNQTFLLGYHWMNVINSGFYKIVEIDGKQYMIGTTISSDNLIPPSVRTKGDITCSGNLRIMDTSGSDLFQVDMVNRNIMCNGNIGIGISNPSASLQINNSTMDDIINTLNISATQMKYNQILLDALMTCSDDTEFSTVIEQFYRDHISSIQKTNNSFLTINKISKDTMLASDMTCIYNGIYPSFEGKPYSIIKDLDPNLITVNTEYIDLYQSILNNFELFDRALINENFEYVFGFRRLGLKCFEFKENLYILENGLYIAKYNFNIYTDKNLYLYFDYSKECKQLLNSCYLSFFPETVSYNKDKQADILASIIQKYPSITQNILVIEPIETNDFKDSKIGTYNFGEIYIDNSIKISDIIDNALKQKYYIMIIRLITYYEDNYKSSGYTGVVYFDDNINDYKGSFMVIQIEGVYKILLIDMNLNTIINPSILVSGDMKLQGDLVLTNKSTGINTINMNPIDNYIGIGTDERYNNYSNTYMTTSDIYTSQHHLYCKNSLFPNAVFERHADDSTYSTGLFAVNLATVSASNARRKSDKLSFKEMIDYTSVFDEALKMNTTGDYDNVTNVIYGVDISFELTDNTGITKEIGGLAMVIDKYDDVTGEIGAGFCVNAYDKDIVTGGVINKNLIYVDNDSTLYIKKIMLNGKVLSYDPDTNELTFDGKKVNI